MNESRNITGMLVAWNNGEQSALEKLMPLVEQELRRIAHNYMRRENAHHTLQTTALVNEAYLKLRDQRRVTWQNRAHFFGLSAQIMRRILLKYARDRACEKRGGAAQHIALSDFCGLTQEKSIELIALDEALDRLARLDPMKSKIVEMRYFGGLTVEETAEVIGVAAITIAVHWRLAKAWLAREIKGQNERHQTPKALAAAA